MDILCLIWIGVSLFLTLGLIIAQLNDIQKASSFANLLNITLAILEVYGFQ